MNEEKTSLPSIKDLLEGGPGLIDYSQHSSLNNSNQKKNRHRRHASEHITGSHQHHSFRSPTIPPLPPPPPPPSLPSTSYNLIEKPPNLLLSTHDINQEKATIHAATLPFEMQSLSLEKKPEPLALKNLLIESTEADESTPHTNRRRTHSRSYSDFTHPYSPFNKNQNDTNTRTSPLHQIGKLPIAPTPLSLMPIRPKFHSPELEDNKLTKKDKDKETEELEDKEVPAVYKQPFSKTIMNHHEQPNLEAHMNTNATKYVCPYCSKGFTRPSSLRTHTYSHTGEKPFLCTEPGCGRKFSVQSNLRRHLRVHRIKKPSTLFLPKNIH